MPGHGTPIRAAIVCPASAAHIGARWRGRRREVWPVEPAIREAAIRDRFTYAIDANLVGRAHHVGAGIDALLVDADVVQRAFAVIAGHDTIGIVDAVLQTVVAARTAAIASIAAAVVILGNGLRGGTEGEVRFGAGAFGEKYIQRVGLAGYQIGLSSDAVEDRRLGQRAVYPPRSMTR